MTPTTVDLPSQLHFWDQWHRRRGATGRDDPQVTLRDRFLEVMGDLPAPSVLDLGCGQGHDAIAFARAGMTVNALDFSATAVAAAESAVRAERLPVEMLERDLRDPLPYAAGSFDGVYSHLALHYFDDAQTRAIFGEIWRVLRPGGWLVFSVKSVDDPYYRTGEKVGPDIYCRNGHLRHFFSPEYTDRILADWSREIRQLTGRYASAEPSAFIHAVAQRPG